MCAHQLIAVTMAILIGGGLNVIQPKDIKAQHDDGMRATSWEQRACAAFDLHILTIMEEASAAQPTSIRLVEATQILLQARAACRDGNAIEALRLYSTIDLPRPPRALQPILGLH